MTEPPLKGNRWDLCNRLNPRFSDLLWRMERKGVWVSEPQLERIVLEASADQKKHRATLDEMAGKEVNWESHPQTAWFVYKHLGLPPVPTNALPPKLRDKQEPTGKECLDYLRLHYPERRGELDTLRAYRRATKAIDYATKLLRLSFPAIGYPGYRILHPCYGTYNDTSTGQRGDRDKSGTATGRLSISNPPLQQIPRDKKKDPYRLRKAFVAPPGFVLSVCDLSQLEVRIQAHLHVVLFGDDTLAKLCKESDFHAVIAQYAFGEMWPDWRSEVTGQSVKDIKPEEFKGHPDPFVPWMREKEKELFYGLGYGKADKSFGATMWDLDGNPMGTEFAQRFRAAMYSRIPAMPKFVDWVKERVARFGGMHSLLGRWRPVTRDRRGERQAQNQVPQGGGSEIAEVWMLTADAEGIDQRLQVHDELHAYTPEATPGHDVGRLEALSTVAGELCGLREDTCPLAAEGHYGTDWDSCK
jgi:DNA polymerase-1